MSDNKDTKRLALVLTVRDSAYCSLMTVRENVADKECELKDLMVLQSEAEAEFEIAEANWLRVSKEGSGK